MSGIFFYFCYILLLVNLNESVQQLVDISTKQLPQTVKDSLVLPYILKKQNENNLKRYTLLATNSGTDNLKDVANEDESPPVIRETQEQNAVITKPSLRDNWDRAHYYIPNHLQPPKFSTLNSYDKVSTNSHKYLTVLPLTIVILINLGILSYVLVGILGFLNRLLHLNTGFLHEGYDNSGQFYFKNNYNDDI